MADLFPRRPPRRLDDEELDSGDDEGRYDRVADRMDYDEAEDGDYGETVNVMDLSLGRAPEPESTSGEVCVAPACEATLANIMSPQVYTMAVPNFLSIETEEFNPETYVAPPFSTAATSLCWRFDPNDESRLQSNARIIRWEDGSLTLQLASAPKEQYRIASKPLAPLNKAGDYESEFDAHTYLGAAAETASVFRITSHLTHALTVLPTAMETDDAVQRLQESLARSKKNPDGTVTMIDVKEDPELAKKQAELAEREKLKAARRRQQMADRDLERGRRFGVPYRTGGAGLTVGGLEGDDEMLTTKPRAKKPPRKPNRRGEIYTDEEEEHEHRRGRTREDRYDENDGFLVGSDEEPEEAAEEEEEEEEELEDEDMDAEGEADEDVAPARKERSESPKRKSPAPEAAGGAGTQPVRKKHRYVVDDDDDE